MVSMMIFFGVAQAIQPGVSYNLGAENLNRIRAFLRLGTAVNIVVGIIMFLLMFFFAEPLASIFAKNNLQLIELTVHISKLFSFSFLISGINIILSMFFTSMHRAKDSVIIALSRSLVFILTGLAFLPLLLGNNGIWLAVVFAELMTLLVSLFLFKKKPLDESNIDVARKSLKQVS
jgi:Na+-driven multidrug efflux pump